MASLLAAHPLAGE